MCWCVIQRDDLVARSMLEMKTTLSHELKQTIKLFDGMFSLTFNHLLTFVLPFSQIPVTTTRILLNHFRWDKEKLMERYYDGDQEALFKAAHVINPYVKPNRQSQVSLQRPLTFTHIIAAIIWTC